MGTVDRGRDVLVRLAYGFNISMTFALVVAAIGESIGIAVGAMLGGGHEVEPDRPEAQKWFQAAADKGHAYAQMMLGRYLSRGLAGEQDFDRARIWLDKAVAGGLVEAHNDLAELAAKVAT